MPAKRDDGVELTWPGKHRVALPKARLRRVEAHGASEPRGTLIRGDNLRAMAALLPKFSGKVDLVYADPPFATGSLFHLESNGKTAYRDSWDKGVPGYLQMLYERLWPMRELLSARGTLWLHLDWRVSHHARLLLDEVFGRDAFRNMVVWHYGGRGAKAVAGQMPRNYDTLLVYAKSPVAALNRAKVATPLSAEAARAMGYRRGDDGRWFKTAPRGDYTDASVARLESEGRVHRTQSGSVRVKYFLAERDGAVLDERLVGDVWDDIPDMMHAPKAERTGYPTQKPEALLERIVEMASKPGDTVADLFCGSGTTLSVAQRLGRRWLGCDESDAAIETTMQRMTIAGAACDVSAV
ncbi:MAG: site-specific DNA-methyltransferase [Chloroflexi bacterium]|nr:site-specific DNA-methyltransferase [Chloroflexota bacterium]